LRYALEHKAHVLGMDWARYLETRIKDDRAAALSSGLGDLALTPSPQSFAEDLSSVFSVGHIFQVDYLGLDCMCHLQADARTPVTQDRPAAHAPAQSDMALSDMPAKDPRFVHHGMSDLVQYGGFPTDIESLARHGQRNARDIKIMSSDQPGLPATFAAVYHTVLDNGRPDFILRVMVNLERQHTQFSILIFTGMGISALFLVISAGIPLWRLFKSKTAKREADARAGYLATHDVLTGLYNRNSFQERLPQLVHSAIARRKSGLLFLFDLNGFKEVNDFYGHDIGDALLIHFAEWLTRHSPEGAYVARLGGDEFVIILTDIQDPKADPAAKLEMPLKLALPIGAGEEQVTAGIAGGVVRFPQDSELASDLVQMADLALYTAKANASGEIRAYTPEMSEAFQERLSQKEEFRKALKRREIIPFFQPIVDASTGQVEGLEALARWQHPDKGLLSPAAFSEALKDNELSAKLGVAMFAQVIDHMVDWQARGIPFKRVALNATNADLKRANLAQDILKVLAARGLSPAQLTIEVTENCLFGKEDSGSLEVLETLRAAGCNIALDDFGTGYSSITQLKELPISIVKVDKSFIDNILDNPDDQSIIGALHSLSKAMRFDLVLEGVETPEQLDYLKASGFTFIQGHYFSKPIPEAEVGPFIAFQNNRGVIIPFRRTARRKAI
ncbi:MAG: EAL domain-containing protein, partial [Pseudomonadota bacterium]